MVTWSGLVLVLLSTVLGWATLWPARRSLGTLAYHLYAFPVGLLAWSTAGATTTLLGLDFRTPGVALGLALFVVLVAGAQRIGSEAPQGQTPPWWSLLLTGAALAAVCVVMIFAGYTIGSWDSIVHYEGGGLWLYDTGTLSPQIMGEWAPLIPSMHAANRLLGGHWNYVPYPVLALHVLALLGLVLHRFAFASLPRVPRALLTGVTVLVLATLPSFAFHALYVHSQMISAAYLLGALVALRHAWEDGPGRAAWVTVSALCAAGLALARPDGLAYVFVPLTVAGVLALDGRWHLRERLRHGLLLWFLVASPYLSAMARAGLYASRKLPATQALGMLGVLLLAVLVLVVVPTRERLARVLADRGVVISLFVAPLALIPVILAFDAQDLATTVSNMVGNLLYAGGYGNLWYVLASGVVVTLAFPRLRRASDFSDLLGLALVQFFAIALVVHTLGHPGRLSMADSFNRVAFHTVPVFLWYLAAFAGTALHVVLLARTPPAGDTSSLDTAGSPP